MGKPCLPCQENAVLRVGDAICHRIQKSTGRRVDCHGLIHAVKGKKLTLTEYINRLDDVASPNEKEYLKKLRESYPD